MNKRCKYLICSISGFGLSACSSQATLCMEGDFEVFRDLSVQSCQELIPFNRSEDLWVTNTVEICDESILLRYSSEEKGVADIDLYVPYKNSTINIKFVSFRELSKDTFLKNLDISEGIKSCSRY